MIINIRGASGSGKSWICRQLLTRYPPREEVLMIDQVTVEGYRLSAPRPTFLVGEYKRRRTSSGGCDTFSHLKDPMGIIEDVVSRQHRAGQHVIFEGIRVSAGHTRWLAFAEAYPVDWRLIYLNTSLEQCLANQQTRRALAATTRPDTTLEKTTRDHLERMRRQVEQFHDSVFSVYEFSAGAALENISSWIGTALHTIGDWKGA